MYWFYSSIVCSVASVAGHFVIILIIYRTKTLRTTTNLFIANMAISDVVGPALEAIGWALFYRKDAVVVSHILGTTLCKIIFFLVNTSYGVSMSNLVVSTVHRFYAVAFPIKAKLQSRKPGVSLLLCTWIIPMAVCWPFLYYSTYVLESKECYLTRTSKQFMIWIISFLVVFYALPILFLLVLYPVIVIKLVRQKVPGNLSSQSEVRKRKRNISVTKMLITVTVTLILTHGTFQVVYVFSLVPDLLDSCVLDTIYSIIYPFPYAFHAINPVIYFIFCLSYRQGLKHIFFCCCPQSVSRRNLPGGEQIALENEQQQGNNNNNNNNNKNCYTLCKFSLK